MITAAMPWGPTPLGELARPKLWAKARAHDHAQDKDRGISVPLTGQKELASRASAGQGKGQTGQRPCRRSSTDCMVWATG